MQEPLPSRLLILFLLSPVLIEVSLEVTPPILMRWHRSTMNCPERWYLWHEEMSPFFTSRAQVEQPRLVAHRREAQPALAEMS
jgi:hypothetical protein